MTIFVSFSEFQRIRNDFETIQRKVERGSQALKGLVREDWVKFHPGHDILQFLPVFQKFSEFTTTLRLFIS
jgi:hypothetical protein